MKMVILAILALVMDLDDIGVVNMREYACMCVNMTLVMVVYVCMVCGWTCVCMRVVGAAIRGAEYAPWCSVCISVCVCVYLLFVCIGIQNGDWRANMRVGDDGAGGICACLD